jgi:type I restriction enzyme S subunit
VTPTAIFDARRLKYAATINDEALSESTDADFELAYIDIGNVDSQGRVHDIVNYQFEDAPSRARRIVRDGDVIISTVRTYLQAIAPIEDPPENLIVSTGFAVVRPSNVLDHRFCKYALRANRFLWEVESRSTGVSYPAINASDLGDIKMSLPEIGTQRLIANYLDRETVRIDGLIAEKGRMLALLEEKRAALISRVVTRGLDPRAPLKPSGQEWLGEIPAHWPTTKFSWDVFISEGQVDPEDGRFSEMILIAPNHIESRTGQVIYTETSADQGAISGKYLCRKGDVIYSKIRPALRKAALADEDCLCSADMYALRPSERLLPNYLQYFLLSEDFSTWAELESARVAMPKINRETLSAIRIPVPPLPEQEHIVTEIRKGTERIDLQRKAIRESIDLLKERRAALITAAVTGQILLEEMTE